MSSTVLVVDDDQDMRELMCLAVQRAGLAVRVAVDGQDALEQVARELPDLILLDLCMPLMDGWTFARAFHQRYGTRVPIVLVTSVVDAQQAADELGVTGCLDKPSSIRQFACAVRAYVPTGGTPTGAAAA